MFSKSKRVISAIVSVLMLFSFGSMSFATNEVDNKDIIIDQVIKGEDSLEENTIKDIIYKFVENCMSDMVKLDEIDFSMVSEDALFFKEFIKDKKTVKENSVIADQKLRYREFGDIDIKFLSENKAEVFINLMEYYNSYLHNDEGEEGGREVNYKINLQKNEISQWKVVSAISDDYTLS